MEVLHKEERMEEKGCQGMNRLFGIVLGTVMMAWVLLLGGCAGGGQEWKDAESWAYVHDAATEILRLGKNGNALYNGEAFQYEKDDTYLTLTGKDGKTLKLRYEMKKDKMLLYETTVYHFVSGSDQEHLIGLWKGGEQDRLSYEFTGKGTFLEDGIFPGHYLVEEEAGTIKLMYNDHFEDTWLYYQLADGELTIEYPWPMVKTQD